MTDEAPAPSPSPAPKGDGDGGGMLSVLAPPKGGAARALWLGMILLVASFALKQIMLDWALMSAGTVLEEPRLMLQKDAEITKARGELDFLEEELQGLEQDRPLAPEDPMDKAKNEEFQEKQEAWDKTHKELSDKIAELKGKAKPKEKGINEEYRPKITNATHARKQAQVTAIRRVQWTLWLKLLFDLGKLLGAALVIFAALRINLDPEQEPGLKSYSTVLGGVAFLAVVLGGIVALLG